VNLVGYMQAEFNKAARLRVWLFSLQLIAAIPPAVSVLIPDYDKLALYILAIVATALLSGWWVLNSFYARFRSAAHAARRAALLLGGMNAPLSATAIQSLRERFTVTDEQASLHESPTYYATTLPPGPARLAEMLEESAFYSENLQKVSKCVMLGVLLLFVIAFVVVALAITPFAKNDTIYLVIRVFMAFLVFAMSADVFGAYAAHKRATDEIKEVRHRLSNADKAGYPQADVLLAFADYNTAVEEAPESVPYAYKWRRQELERRWNTYQQDRANERAQR
jgi:hypothetical protein